MYTLCVDIAYSVLVYCIKLNETGAMYIRLMFYEINKQRYGVYAYQYWNH